MMKSNKRLILILITSLIFAGINIPAKIFSQWKKEVIGKGAYPSIAIDPKGDIHSCFFTKSFDGDLIYAYKSKNQWIIDTLVRKDGMNQCAIVVDNISRIHIAFVERDWDTNKCYLKHMIKEGSSWSSPELITTSDYGIWALSFAVDNENHLHFGYMRAYTMASHAYLVYISNREGEWKIQYPVLLYDDYAYDHASMAIDKNGYAHFAFYNMLNGPSYVTNTPDGNWSGRQTFHSNWSAGQMEGMQIDIAIDTGNIPHISYVGSDRPENIANHRHATRENNKWITQLVDNGSSQSATHAVACDLNGVTHIAYIHYNTGELRYAMNSSGSWPHVTLDKPGVKWGGKTDMVTDKNSFVHIMYEDYEYVYYVTNRLEIPAPNIVLSPPEMEFGTVDTGAVSTKIINIKNEGVLDLHISDVKLTGGNSSEFSLECDCENILPEESCPVSITFAPKTLGKKQTTLEISSDDPDEPLKKSAITGRTPYPTIQPEPSELIFDPTETGKTDTLFLNIKNTGDANLEIDSLRFSVSNQVEFAFQSSCSIIPPSEECKIRLTFTPVSTGTSTGNLLIYSNDPEHSKIQVSMKGRTPSARLEMHPGDVLDFGTVPIGNLTSRQILLCNTGEIDLEISARNISGTDASLFNAANNCTIVGSGESCNIQMNFHPVSDGLKSGLFTIFSNDPDIPEFNLTLMGTGGRFHFSCLDTLTSGDFIAGGTTGKNAYLAAISPGGDIIWQKEYSDTSASYISIRAVRELWDKGFVVAGAFRETGKIYSNRWIARLDQHGEILWQKQTEDYGEINDTKVTSDSCFISVGVNAPNPASNNDLWTGKFDPEGNLLWQKCIGEDDTKNWESGMVVLETDDKNFIVACKNGSGTIPYYSLHKHPDGGFLYGGSETVLLKISKDGTIIWQKVIDFDTNITTSHYWLAHISSEDNILWQYSYSQAENFEWIYDLSINSSGDIFALGVSFGYQILDMRLMRLSKTGNIVWQKIYKAPGDQQGNKVQAHSSGSIAVVGDYDIEGTNETNGWFCLFNPDGTLCGCSPDYLENTNATATATSVQFKDKNLPVRSCPDDYNDASMVKSEGNMISLNLCAGISADMDSDGVSNEEESGPSGKTPNFDGNNDGLPDAQQNNATSLHSFDSLAYVTIDAPSGVRLKEVSATDNPSPADQPGDFEFPIGFFDFTVTGIDTAASVPVNLIIPEGLTPTTYYKYAKTKDNNNPHWYEFLYDDETGAEIEPERIILHFKDGARGDEDLMENAMIKDIGGPAVKKATGTGVKPDVPESPGSVTIYPNPFNTSINIEVNLSQAVQVKIEIYNILGNKMITLINEKIAPGSHNVEFHSESLPGGIYFFRIDAGAYKDIKKMMLIK